MTWRDQSACKGQNIDIFYPPGDDMPKGRDAPNIDPYAHARTICDQCPVQTQCLVDVVTTGDTHGFRAGHTPDELDKVIHTRNGVIAKVCDWCGDPYACTRRESNRRYCGGSCSKQALRKARREYNRRVRGVA